MTPSDVAVATITWVRSRGEERLIRRSLRRLAGAGLPVAVADRRSSPQFARFLRGLRHVRATDADGGLLAQVQAALRAAAQLGTPFILYTEPDKERFFAKGLTDFVRRAPDASATGVVLASRSRAAFATFPPMQRYVEGVVNHLSGTVIGVDGDYTYGPFLMNRCLVPDVCAISEDLRWGWRLFACAAARRRGLRVHHHRGDYACPPDQRRESAGDRMHRLRQLSENVNALALCSASATS